MSSQGVDYDTLEATTSIEEITEDTILAAEHGDYVLDGSTEELGWLGHFMKKSTRLNEFRISGGDALVSCSGQSVDKFIGDLSKCNHIQKMTFAYTDLAEIIYKLGPAMINDNITQLTVEGCFLGVPEATFLFNTFRDMNSLEELCIDCDDGFEHDLNDVTVAGCIPSLAACKGMRKLKLNFLDLSTNSCAALSAIFPEMAALLELDLRDNLIDDDCVQVLSQGLSEFKQMRSLNLSHNRISDNGLDVLIQGLPASVDTLNLARNDVTLTRQLPLLRFKKLDLCGNTLSLDGPRVIAASLANPECRLKSLSLNQCNIADEGVAILAPSLRKNQRLTRMSLAENNISKEGWSAFSSILCDASSINATHGSNHTLQSLGSYRQVPQDIKMLLELNSDQDKSRVAAKKILQVHRHLDMRPFLGMELDLLPGVVAWLNRFAESRPDLKLSSIFEFVRAMPMKSTDRLMDVVERKKCKLSN
ncbi:hypothetical protein THAOC_26268 [Thalassiosira oceanica]|uniref:Uncharacterized protein n=1 Tax=Thalassiosira oceanica TaxID=159749 RepID=K0RPF9_THAOC|nr:hypothetical protein THAOC_26268 [Thalassiosira oceanica]|eukprot:EJK54169.1 hypothetical protein THAOC_26268 [Thalassiosira oceanica]